MPGLPGLIDRIEAFGETTLVVDPARILEACLHLRDEEGFDMLADLAAVDYLGWGGVGVAGYIGTASGRGISGPGSSGLQRLPEMKPKRFAIAYHLVGIRPGAPRVRVKVFLDDGEALDSVVSVWPTADWHEREAFDLMGIHFDGHPNLKRLLMDEDWEGHPLRKDYAIGEIPVQFKAVGER